MYKSKILFVILSVHHKLAQFEQTRMIRTTQNVGLFEKKPFTMITISEMSLAPFWKKVSPVKQLNDAKIFITRLPSFIIPKNTVAWHMKPG